MSKVLGVVYRTITTYLIKKAGYNKKTARTGAVTLIQRFGSALNLNIHFHMLFLDRVYIDDAGEESHQRFVPVTHHRVADIANLTHKISLRIARYLERAGIIERDAENSYLVTGANDQIWRNIKVIPFNTEYQSDSKAAEKRGAMTWAARLKRVFNMDMKICEACGGAVRVVSCIDDPVIINKILSHLQMTEGNQIPMPASRAPPVALLLS